MKEHRIILPVSEIPSRATVSKVSGTKRYFLRRTLKVHPVPVRRGESKGEVQTLQAPGGAYLVPMDGGDVSTCLDSQDLIWYVQQGVLQHYLDKDQGYEDEVVRDDDVCYFCGTHLQYEV